MRDRTILGSRVGAFLMLLSLVLVFISGSFWWIAVIPLMLGFFIVLAVALTCQCPACGRTLGLYLSVGTIDRAQACPFCGASL